MVKTDEFERHIFIQKSVKGLRHVPIFEAKMATALLAIDEMGNNLAWSCDIYNEWRHQ